MQPTYGGYYPPPQGPPMMAGGPPGYYPPPAQPGYYQYQPSAPPGVAPPPGVMSLNRVEFVKKQPLLTAPLGLSSTGKFGKYIVPGRKKILRFCFLRRLLKKLNPHSKKTMCIFSSEFLNKKQ